MKDEHMKKIIETGKPLDITITLEDAYAELYDICDREHSSCNRECPVFNLSLNDGDFKANESFDCPYFKNGKHMFERLQGKKLCKVIVNGKTKIIDFFTANKLLNTDSAE